MTNPDDAAYNIECVHCGLLPTVAYRDIGREIATHYFQFHPDEADVIRVDEQYRVYAAPERCDFCNAIAELPHWTHTATPPIPLIGFEDSGKWLICDPCHDLIEAKDVETVLNRYWMVQSSLTPALVSEGLRQAVMDHVRSRLTLMMDRFDHGTRNTVG